MEQRGGAAVAQATGAGRSQVSLQWSRQTSPVPFRPLRDISTVLRLTPVPVSPFHESHMQVMLVSVTVDRWNRLVQDPKPSRVEHLIRLKCFSGGSDHN